MITRFIEYGFVLAFPILVFIVTLAAYPVDYSEARVLVGEEGLQAVGYIPTLIVASGYRDWVLDSGVVEDVKVESKDRIYVLVVTTSKGKFKILLVKPSVETLDIGVLRGSNITFYGVQIDYKGDSFIVARVLVTGSTYMPGMHGAMCIHHEKIPYEKCEEMMRKHAEMMRKMHDRKKD